MKQGEDAWMKRVDIKRAIILIDTSFKVYSDMV